MKRIIFILVWLTHIANGELVRNNFEGVRPTGMGNAFLALADDANAIWYNPAGLARIKKAHVNLFDFILGADSLDTASRIGDAVFNGNYKDLYRTDTQFVRFSALPSLIVPYFGLSIYDNIFGFADLGNLTQGTVDIYAFNDLAVIGGIGIPLGDYLSIGFSVRAIQRSGIDATLSVSDLMTKLGTNPNNFLANVYNELKKLAGTGWGVGANVGAILRVPLATQSPKFQLAATVEDVGRTTFKKMGGPSPPPPIEPSFHAGAALLYTLGKRTSLNFVLDSRHLLEDLPINKMMHAGVELKAGPFGFRLGAHQGYPTAGLSIETPPHTRIYFSTYAVELGDDWWERDQRWYLLQLNIGFNPI